MRISVYSFIISAILIGIINLSFDCYVFYFADVGFYAQDSSSSSLSRPQPEVAPPPPPPDWAAMVVAASMYSAKRRMAVFCTSPILANTLSASKVIFLSMTSRQF